MNEVWKDIVGYENCYQISNLGNVKSLKRLTKNSNHVIPEKVLKPIEGKTGYLVVNLYKEGKRKTKKIHQLVAIAFLNHTPSGMTLVINHIDLNKYNNKVDNLEIVTNRVNTNLKHLPSTSKYTGVYWDKIRGMWRARIVINKKKCHLGYFTNELDASNAYENKLKEITPPWGLGL